MKLIMSVSLGAGVENCNSYILAFQGDQLLVQAKEEKFRFPECREFEAMKLTTIRQHYLGTLDGRHCYSAELDTDLSTPRGFSLVGLREIFGVVDEELFSLAVHAIQIINWDKMHQYCGKCGARTGYALEERAKYCGSCGSVYYPRISPAVIVAVKKGNELLLLRNKIYKHDFYSVLAGFVEPGESLEECLVREVREEANIEVKNIKYFASQSWPFPNSLMVGFTADYAGGDLRVDGKEIADADWYRPDNFPKIPGSISIARRLIDAFVNEQGQKQPE
jgi:NAD+ diphosphatase